MANRRSLAPLVQMASGSPPKIRMGRQSSARRQLVPSTRSAFVTRLIYEVTNALRVEGTNCRRAEDWRPIRIFGGEPLAIWTKGANDLRFAIYYPVLSVDAATEV